MATDTDETASVEQFEIDVAPNFMGDRERMKAVGPFVVEQYERAGFHRRRMREGKPEQGCVTVWLKDPHHKNGWSGWGGRSMIPVEEAREVYDDLTDPEQVREWCDENPNVQREGDA